ncbi:MAG: HAD family hydrolase [Verrucomicrobia bacterium]|jgi:D-glycero-D-manno-heptose 1,7-bisphosphate phosphatase|nr:HAD family hydrolase [Verrucomicrobiota bacterium]
MKQKCVFFDRDGVVNVSPGPGYVERWEDFHLIPEFVAAARCAAAKGYAVVIATNQRGVARGIMSQKTLDAMHAKLRSALSEQGVELLGIFCCTHERDSCDCRKPLPGLLLQAASEHAIDLTSSWMIGDKETDVAAGRAAGCHTILVSGLPAESEADLTVGTMAELAASLDSILG